MREREQLSGRGSLPARVAEVHLLALSHLEVCGEKNVGPCVAMLCVDLDIVHGCCKTTGLGLFYTKQVWCRRTALQEVQSEAKRSRKRKCTK